jgi:hypothetical protein
MHHEQHFKYFRNNRIFFETEPLFVHGDINITRRKVYIENYLMSSNITQKRTTVRKKDCVISETPVPAANIGAQHGENRDRAR